MSKKNKDKPVIIQVLDWCSENIFIIIMMVCIFGGGMRGCVTSLGFKKTKPTPKKTTEKPTPKKTTDPKAPANKQSDSTFGGASEF